MKSKKTFILGCLLSLLALFATPSSVTLSLLAYFIGYPALFIAAYEIQNSKKRALFVYGFGVLYFLYQMRWMAFAKYHGLFIIVAYLLISVFLSLNYLLLGKMLPKEQKSLNLQKIIEMALVFVLLEYLRLYVSCGFPFHIVGLILSSNPFSLQLASVIGGYGLSFAVIVVALLCAKFFYAREWIEYLAYSILPFGIGAFVLVVAPKISKERKPLRVAMFQTGLKVEEKLDLSISNSYIEPELQLRRIVYALEKADAPDLVVLPEVCLPGDGQFKKFSGLMLWNVLPLDFAAFFSLEEKYSTVDVLKELSIYLNADILAGVISDRMNSALYFSQGELLGRYNKKRLLLLGEYLPFTFLQKMAAKYGVHAFFIPGRGENLIEGAWNILPSICYDEGFPDDFITYKNKPFDVHVNLTNDAWFIDSNLAMSHFYLSRLRSVENGMYTLRACNTGVSAIISPTGALEQVVEEKDENGNLQAKLIEQTVTPYVRSTIFPYLGNKGIFMIVAFVWFVLHAYSQVRSRLGHNHGLKLE